MAISFLDFFGSDPSKMDQTCKFGEQTSQILEFKPEGLHFYLSIFLLLKLCVGMYGKSTNISTRLGRGSKKPTNMIT